MTEQGTQPLDLWHSLFEPRIAELDEIREDNVDKPLYERAEAAARRAELADLWQLLTQHVDDQRKTVADAYERGWAEGIEHAREQHQAGRAPESWATDREPFECRALYHHGPGHQSRAKCERKDPHGIDDEHYARNPMCPDFEWHGLYGPSS